MNPNIQIIQVSGILDGIRGNQLQKSISDVVEEGTEVILVDLQNLTFIDSSGLGSLISIQKIVRSMGGMFFLCSIKNQVKMMFELTQMSRVFKIFADRNEFAREIMPLYHHS